MRIHTHTHNICQHIICPARSSTYTGQIGKHFILVEHARARTHASKRTSLQEPACTSWSTRRRLPKGLCALFSDDAPTLPMANVDAYVCVCVPAAERIQCIIHRLHKLFTHIIHISMYKGAEEFARAPNKSVREERIVCDLKSRDNYVKRAINSATLECQLAAQSPRSCASAAVGHMFHAHRR